MLDKLKARAEGLRADVLALVFALGHMGTPLLAKLLAALTVAYALSPIDLIPDFIPVIGYLDDLIILPALVVATVKLIPAPVMAACRERAQNYDGEELQKRWLYALPVIAVYALLIYILYRMLFK